MKMKKYIGVVLYRLVAKHFPMSYTPILGGVSRKFRSLCGKLMLEKCGVNVNIERKAVFSSRLELGDNSGIGAYASIEGKVIIGNDVMMGPWCTIYNRNHKFSNIEIPIRLQGYDEERLVIIEDNAWIGGHVIILPGVRISTGAVIAAGSVVTKDVPSYALVGGNPARIIRYRNNNSE